MADYNLGYHNDNGFWEALAPGEFIQALDAITADTQFQHRQTPFQVPIRRRMTVEEKDDSIPAATSDAYDYDAAYEDFVKRYFDKSTTDDNHDYRTTSSDEDSLIEPSKTHSQRTKCKKVYKNHQKCLVCKNPRNGEASETCSYNSKTKPHGYAYKKEKNYHRYHDSPDENSEESTENSESKTKAANTTEEEVEEKTDDDRAQSTTRTGKSVRYPKDFRSCPKQSTRNKVCYHCDNAEGEKSVKCFTKATSGQPSEPNGKAKKLRKSQKRIHKPTYIRK